MKTKETWISSNSNAEVVTILLPDVFDLGIRNESIERAETQKKEKEERGRE